MKDPACNFPCYQQYRNTVLQNKKPLDAIGLVVFDMDGVLIDAVSSWKYIHDHFNTSNEHSVKAYVMGEIDDEEFIRRDVHLWKEQGKLITEQQLRRLLADIPLMNGATKTLEFLQQNHIPTAIVSAGLDLIAKKTAKNLGINHIYANGIQTDEEGRLTGEGIIGVRLMFKDKTIKHLSETLDIAQNQIVAVGNSCFDIPMLVSCGLGIAFNPSDECVKEYANVVVNGKDLSKIIPILQSFL